MRRGLDTRVSAYLQAVLNKDRGAAEQVIREVTDATNSLAEVYAVLGAAEVEIGLLWEKGTITVSDEHFATAVTLGCVSMAAEKMRKFWREPVGFSFLCAPDGEFHLVGLTMMSELLRREGWETEIHPSGPLSSTLGELAARRRVDLFCLSATMPTNVLRVAEVARDIRQVPAFKTAKILVGGPAFGDRKAREAFGMGLEQSALIDFFASSLPEALAFSRSIGSRGRQA